MAREDEVRLIAYSIWEGEGCPDGCDCEHWYRAEIIWEEQQKSKAPAEAKAAAKPVAATKTETRQPTSRRTPKKASPAAAK